MVSRVIEQEFEWTQRKAVTASSTIKKEQSKPGLRVHEYQFLNSLTSFLALRSAFILKYMALSFAGINVKA